MIANMIHSLITEAGAAQRELSFYFPSRHEDTPSNENAAWISGTLQNKLIKAALGKIHVADAGSPADARLELKLLNSHLLLLLAPRDFAYRATFTATTAAPFFARRRILRDSAQPCICLRRTNDKTNVFQPLSWIRNAINVAHAGDEGEDPLIRPQCISGVSH